MVSTLTLSEVTFSNFEVPEHFNIGGKQRLVVHTLPGGKRVVDAMGPDDAAIQWSGVFTGMDADDRVRSLERMRRDGQTHLMTFGPWRYNVIVQEFEATVAGNQWVPYQIQLCVVDTLPYHLDDWLRYAQSPSLSVGLQSATQLALAITAAELGLVSNDIGQAIAAAGSLAQYETAKIYGIISE